MSVHPCWQSFGRLALVAALCIVSSPSFLAGRVQRGSAALLPGDHTFSIRHDRRQRSYLLHVPPSTRSVRSGQGPSQDRALPVVIAFHGGGGEARGFKRYAGLDAVADREGLLVVYPNGTGPLVQRLLTWNAGDCCGYAMNQRVDDVGFAIAALDDLARRTTIDTHRIYATGHSNGAMMAYRLGAERPDRMVAIAPVAGAHNLDQFAAGPLLAVLHIHSVDDPRALYKGGLGPPFPGSDVRSAHRPVEDGLTRWRRRNSCVGPARTVETRAGTPKTGGTNQRATLLTWDGCVPSGQVAHWKLTGVGHGWPGNPRAEFSEELSGPSTTLVVAAEEIWKFFAPLSR